MKDPNVQKEWAEILRDIVWKYAQSTEDAGDMLKDIQVEVLPAFTASHNNSLVGRLEGLKQKEAKKPCLNAESHLFGQCFECVKTKGWNKAITESQELIKNSLT